MIDYLLAFQVFAAIYVMVAIGYGCSGIKLFNSTNAEAVRKILNYVCIPGLVFHQIGIQPFTLETFKPLLIGLLIQITLQILILFFSFIIPFESKTHQYINFIYSCSYFDCLFAALPISQFLFSETYNYIPVMLSMTQSLIIIPIHNVVTFKILGPPTSDINENSNNNEDEMNLEDQDNNVDSSIKNIPTKRITVNGDDIEKKSKKKSETLRRLSHSSEKLEDNANSTSFLEIDKQDKNDNKSSNIDENENKKFIDPNENKSETENNNEVQEDNISNNNETNKNNDSDNENTTNQNDDNCVKKKCPSLYLFCNKLKVKNIWTTLLWSIFTPINICFILGIIWSAIGITMPKFLNQFVTDLEKAVVAGGLFACGVFMWNHPFFGCSPIEVPITSIIHIVVLPLIGFLFCWIFKVKNEITQIIMFCMAAPSALSSYAAAIYNHYPNSTITFTFFWTYLICLPVFLLWTVVFNQTNIFNVN